jgi:hypothetical protein
MIAVIGCNPYQAKIEHFQKGIQMIRWVVVIFIGLVLFANLLPWLQKLGIGKLPGDLRFKLFGRVFTIPFASTILLSLIILLVAKFLK